MRLQIDSVFTIAISPAVITHVVVRKQPSQSLLFSAPFITVFKLSRLGLFRLNFLVRFYFAVNSHSFKIVLPILSALQLVPYSEIQQAVYSYIV
jgi:hypothetical protein